MYWQTGVRGLWGGWWGGVGGSEGGLWKRAPFFCFFSPDPFPYLTVPLILNKSLVANQNNRFYTLCHRSHAAHQERWWRMALVRPVGPAGDEGEWHSRVSIYSNCWDQTRSVEMWNSSQNFEIQSKFGNLGLIVDCAQNCDNIPS